jgi:hypothetical protein
MEWDLYGIYILGFPISSSYPKIFMIYMG